MTKQLKLIYQRNVGFDLERAQTSEHCSREYHGQCLCFAGQTLVELNLNILVRDLERMHIVLCQV